MNKENKNTKQIAVFGGGCFWCTEAIFQSLRGVESVLPGYSGGQIQHPTYEQVSSGTSGHVEVVRIEFNPLEIKYEDLLTVFFATHDPTTLNRQGHDAGEQYASVVFYSSDAQKQAAENFIAELEQDKTFSSPIVTTLRPLEDFYEAEDYHKNYYANNKGQPYCQVVISPKVAKLREKFAGLLK